MRPLTIGPVLLVIDESHIWMSRNGYSQTDHPWPAEMPGDALPMAPAEARAIAGALQSLAAQLEVKP